MDFKVIWSDEAIADLHDACSYIAQHDPDAARRLGNGILDHVRILASFPLIGPTYPRGAAGPLRQIVFRSDRIFYDVSEELRRVEILHVWHGAREEPKALSGRTRRSREPARAFPVVSFLVSQTFRCRGGIAASRSLTLVVRATFYAMRTTQVILASVALIAVGMESLVSERITLVMV